MPLEVPCPLIAVLLVCVAVFPLSAVCLAREFELDAQNALAEDNLSDDDEYERDPRVFDRTTTLLPMEKMEKDQVRIVGLGGIGRHLALQAAAVIAQPIPEFAEGGQVPTGSELPGSRAGTDNTPAMLTPGEVILNAKQHLLLLQDPHCY